MYTYILYICILLYYIYIYIYIYYSFVITDIWLVQIDVMEVRNICFE